MNNKLIKINTDNKVDGRSLHEFLQVETRYNDWFPRMVEYGFVEGVDFYSKMSETSSKGGRPSINHEMTIDMAKEISMIQRTERGKQARLYFIECEKRAKVMPITYRQIDEPSAQRAKASLLNAETRQARLIYEIASRSENRAYRQAGEAIAINMLAGKPLLDMPLAEQRTNHELGYFCQFIGKPATWASVLGKKLKQAGIKKTAETGVYKVAMDKANNQRDTFYWFDDVLLPILEKMFPEEYSAME